MARAVVECSHRPFDHGALDAPLDGLMMQSERPDLVECSVEVSRANRSPRNVADFRLEPSLIKASAKGIDLCQWNPRPSAYANYIVGSLASRDKYHIYDLWKYNRWQPPRRGTMRQFTIAAATIAIAALISAAPASAENVQGGPIKQNGQCWQKQKGSEAGTFGYWQPCVEKANSPTVGQPARHRA
jgi:hypothetical protein